MGRTAAGQRRVLILVPIINATTFAAKARVALFKGLLIFGAALAVAGQIGWRLTHFDTPALLPSPGGGELC